MHDVVLTAASARGAGEARARPAKRVERRRALAVILIGTNSTDGYLYKYLYTVIGGLVGVSAPERIRE